MKNFILVSALMLLAACGTIGIGSNQTVNIHNDSDEVLTASGSMGIIRIQPNESQTVRTNESITLRTKNKNCDWPTIPRQANTPAIVLNIFPGFILGGIIPTLVDAITGNLFRMPEDFTFEC